MKFPLFTTVILIILAQSLFAGSLKKNVKKHHRRAARKMEPGLKGAEKVLHHKGKAHGGHHKPAGEVKHDFEPSLNELEHLMHGEAGDVHKNDDKPKPDEHHVMEPSIDGLEHMMHGEAGDVHKDDGKPPPAAEHHAMEPSLDGLEHLMHGDAGDVHQNDTKPKPEEHHKMEPSLDGLENLMHENAGNVHDDEHQRNTTTEAKEKRPILPGYEGFHGLLVHGDEAFHHNGADHDHKHENPEEKKNTEKPADMDAFKKWLEEQDKVTKLERFKKLHKEISELEKPKKKHEGDFEFRLPEAVINKFGENEIKRAREKLAKTIRKLEEAERLKRSKVEL